MVDHQSNHELFPSEEIVSEAEQRAGCVVCGEPLSGAVTYRCRNCPALLHEKCTNLPTQIFNHALHRNHTFELAVLDESSLCRFCFNLNKGKFAYRCVIADCKLIIDTDCATKFMVGSFPEKVHFSHEHPLVSIDDQVDQAEIHTCNACGLSLAAAGDAPVYVCLQCNFWLHHKCFDLPRKISHPSHRKHPLMLVAALSVRQYNRACDVCSKHIYKWSLFYHCRFCSFDVHVDCVSLPQILKSLAHPHSLQLLQRICKFMCDGSAEKVEGALYICTECNLVLQKYFVDTPYSVTVTRHHHKLVHTFSTMTEEPDKVECRLCGDKLNPRYGHYSCPECDYFTHTICAWDRQTPYRQVMFEKFLKFEGSLPTDSSPPPSKSEASLLDESTDNNEEQLVKIVEYETIGDGFTRPAVIQHVCYPKPLYRGQQISTNDDIRCYACWLRITDSSIFRCLEYSQFFLHETCAFMPRKLKHWTHPHTLTLGYENLLIVCKACKYESDGLYYRCHPCNFSICLCCAKISDDLEHPGHIHTLIFDTRVGDHTCNGCGSPCGASINGTHHSFAFTCRKCKFFVDLTCLILPEIAAHVYHDHLLTLSFKDTESNPSRIVCNICEEQRDPDHWFYRCSACEFTPSNFKAHAKCVLGKHPFIRIRMHSLMSHAHEHNLQTNKVYDYPECGRCKYLIEDDIAAVCQESDCNFTAHWECATRF